MIALGDPSELGQALKDIRVMQGLTRREVARQIAELTGRSEMSVNSQLWTWDTGACTPEMKSLGPYLQVLGVKLGLQLDG